MLRFSEQKWPLSTLGVASFGEAQAVIDGFDEVLVDAEVVHGGLDGLMAEQQLNLFEGAASRL